MNEKTHGKSVLSPCVRASWTVAYTEEFTAAGRCPISSGQHYGIWHSDRRWDLPTMGELKLNCDVSCDVLGQRMGLGV